MHCDFAMYCIFGLKAKRSVSVLKEQAKAAANQIKARASSAAGSYKGKAGSKGVRDSKESARKVSKVLRVRTFFFSIKV